MSTNRKWKMTIRLVKWVKLVFARNQLGFDETLRDVQRSCIATKKRSPKVYKWKEVKIEGELPLV